MALKLLQNPLKKPCATHKICSLENLRRNVCEKPTIWPSSRLPIGHTGNCETDWLTARVTFMRTMRSHLERLRPDAKKSFPLESLEESALECLMPLARQFEDGRKVAFAAQAAQERIRGDIGIAEEARLDAAAERG
jgi:hypothetical protein